jgi:cytochrome c oxidase cbb3-type subunit 3
MAKIERDDVSGTETTGHEWDGIKELNTPMPRWWLWTFYATVIWGLGYTIAYPAWPLISGATPGLLGYNSRADLSASLAEAKAAQAGQLEKIAASSLEDIVKDEALLQFARAGGAAAFKVNCVQCHGSGAAGSPGYPNLNDDEWIWGGSLDQIHMTLQNGVRSTLSPDTRDSQMPAFGADGLLKPEQIGDVANYVVSLSGGEADAAAVERGKLVWVEGACATCHGEDAKGNQELGGPNLTNQIALYGSSLEAVKAQIEKPRHGVMPAWMGRLDEATLKQLAVYVHSLGGGQ